VPLELARVRPPHLRTSVGLATGIAAFTATAVLALTHNGGAGSRNVSLAALSASGRLRSAPAAGPLGPEDVPIPAATELARAQLVANGQRVDGITCQSATTVLFHIHAHLTIFVDGNPRRVPAGIGIAPPPEVDETPVGAFVAGATCFTWLHTHSADGIIHTESPVTRIYTLGNFFDIWGQPLGLDRVGPARGAVTAFFNGHVFEGNPRGIPLLAHAQIQLDVGRPLIAPEHITFPQGL
jgi:hypothetical protein